MWQAKLEENHGKVRKYYQMPPDQKLCIYFKEKVESKIDPFEFLLKSGCYHLVLKILKYLDASALFAASVVCLQWQSFILEHFYTSTKFRNYSWNKICFENSKSQCDVSLQLKKPRSKIIDICVDDNYNVLTLALISGTPHVMSFSLFTKVRHKSDK